MKALASQSKLFLKLDILGFVDYVLSWMGFFFLLLISIVAFPLFIVFPILNQINSVANLASVPAQTLQTFSAMNSLGNIMIITGIVVVVISLLLSIARTVLAFGYKYQRLNAAKSLTFDLLTIAFFLVLTVFSMEISAYFTSIFK